MDDTRNEPRRHSSPLGGDYWQVEQDRPLWGFADLHAHLMAHLAFGGRAFWGLPYDPEHSGQEGMEHALNSCAPIHGGLVNINPEIGHPAAGGWPDFNVWPRFTTLVHQQAYIDWIRRAYDGGLRLICCLAVNNELLAHNTNPEQPDDDRTAIAKQVAAMRNMIAYIDAQSGGPGKGWMQIALSAEEARRLVTEDKLAVVLGVEVDSLGNWRKAEDLAAQSGGDLDQARRLIGAELDWLYGLGVRQITPIHLADNAFGGTAIYYRFLDTVTYFLTGRHWEVENGWETGIRYRIDRDANDFVDTAERAILYQGHSMAHTPTESREKLAKRVPGLEAWDAASARSQVQGGHANTRGLTDFGRIVLEEMMARAMIIDVDHMSQSATDEALAMAEARDYPVVASHTWLRDLGFTADVEFTPEHYHQYGTGSARKLANESGKRADQVERIARLGGVVAPILNQGDVRDLRDVLPELADKVPEPCAGSSTSWAQSYLYVAAKTGGRGVAIGSDINGAAQLPSPRFGTFAAYSLRDDPYRTKARRGQIARQANGVAYDRPIQEYRWFRFEDSGPGAYDDEEREIWEAIAQFKAGFNPSAKPHPEDDTPRRVATLLRVAGHQKFIDDLTIGLWAARDPLGPDLAEAGNILNDVQHAAYLVVREAAPRSRDAARTRELYPKVKAIWERWQALEGQNPPLARCTAGPRRDWDINLDGMAHYGLLPDLLQDLRQVGLSREDLAPLFRSAEDYIEMWAKATAHSRRESGS